MKEHDLKTHPQPFEALWTGRKRHEFRLNDRDFRNGDILILREWDPSTQVYSGRSLRRAVTYIGIGLGVPEGYCVMSIEDPEAIDWQAAFNKAVGVGVPLPEILERMTKDRDQWRDAAQKELDRANALGAELADIKESWPRLLTGCTAPDEVHCTCVPALRLIAQAATKELADARRALGAQADAPIKENLGLLNMALGKATILLVDAWEGCGDIDTSPADESRADQRARGQKIKDFLTKLNDMTRRAAPATGPADAQLTER